MLNVVVFINENNNIQHSLILNCVTINENNNIQHSLILNGVTINENNNLRPSEMIVCVVLIILLSYTT